MDQKPARMPIKFDSIPPDLVTKKHWVLWKWENRGDKWTKPPYQPNGKPAKSNDPSTWATYAEAIGAYKTGKFDGIGVMLGENLSGVDWDKVRNPESGQIRPDILGKIKIIDSYTEVSPSGTGCKTLLNAKLAGAGHHSKDIGVFNNTRYFCITGHVLPGVSSKIESRQQQLDALIREYWPADFEPEEKTSPTQKNTGLTNDTELIEKALGSRDAKFARLWHGDYSNYASHSEGDCALCTKLAFWTGNDPVRIDALFRMSGLMRDKWQRQDYRDRTINKAINLNSEVYQGNGSAEDSRPKENKNAEVAESETNKKTAEETPTLSLPPYTTDNTRVLGVLTEKPPEPEYLIKFKDKGFMTKGIVGQLAAAGGTGKTQLMIQMARALAAGESFAYFSAEKPIKTLLLVAEETRDDLDRRLWDACSGHFPPDLYVASIKGTVGPLMYLDGNGPKRSEWWHWLDQTIANHLGLEFLMLDPKSRLYGLDENNNDHNTQWVACLETITVKHNISIMFSHHVPKNTKEINQWMGRGGGALTDACRANLGMIALDEKEGKALDLDEDWRSYIKIAISKINVGPKEKGDSYLKFDESGILYPVNVYSEKILSFKEHYLFLLGQEKERYSRRDLFRGPDAKHVAEKMSAAFPSFVRTKHTNPVIDALLEDGRIYETAIQTGAREKLVFKLAD